MKEARFGRRTRRAFLCALPAFAALLWYAPGAIGYVASLRVFAISGGSMGPTLLLGDRVVVETGRGTPERAEVWVFTNPAGQTLIKRVVGLPGETVEVVGGRLLIDGEPLAEPYLSAPMNYAMSPVQLKTGEFFMMGDNRNASLDSHIWGPVPGDRFIGKVVRRYWPRARIGPIR